MSMKPGQKPKGSYCGPSQLQAFKLTGNLLVELIVDNIGGK
jgi:hypothetical protein